MATDHPTGDSCLVPLALTPAQFTLMRKDLADCLEGVREDLKEPDKLADPERASAEAAAYERLLAALAAGRITIPDETARELLRAAIEGHDKEARYAEVVARHDAMCVLLGALEPQPGRFVGSPACLPASDEEREAQNRVLDLILRAHPEPLTFPALGARLMEDPGESEAGYSVACAARDLVSAGLLQSDGLHVLPTRAALHFVQLRSGR
jgi:hypothetical protein